MLTALIIRAITPAPVPAVGMAPNAGDLPAYNVVQQLADGLDSWALIAAMIGVVIGAVVWAFGHYSQNYQQAYNGRKGIMISGLAALLVGAAPEVINFFFAQGGAAK